MSHKIKIFLSLLGLVAFFSVFTFVTSFKVDVPNLEQSRALISFELDDDIDNDGLTNREESYWNTDFQNPDTDGDGYLDGEEVKAGHDPRIPGPNDLLDKPKNITDNLASLITAGLYSQDLKQSASDQEYNKAVNNLSLAVISDFYDSQPATIQESFILIDDSKENQEKYLDNVSGIIKENLLDFPQKLNLDEPLDQQWDFFLIKSQQFKIAYKKVLETPVPDDWTGIHYNILDILNRLSINYTFIGSFDIDPFKAFLALNEVQDNIDSQIKSLLKEIQSKIIENYLDPKDNFYHTLNLLYKQ